MNSRKLIGRLESRPDGQVLVLEIPILAEKDAPRTSNGTGKSKLLYSTHGWLPVAGTSCTINANIVPTRE